MANAKTNPPADSAVTAAPHGPWGFAGALLKRPEYVPMWAMVAIAGALVYHVVERAPETQKAQNAEHLRVIQEERVLDRLFTTERDRLITRAFEAESEKVRSAATAQSQMMMDTSRKLGADMARLEAAIDQLTKKIGSGANGGGCQCREPMPMPSTAINDGVEVVARYCRFFMGIRYVIREAEREDDW